MKMDHQSNNKIRVLFCGDFISKDPQHIRLSDDFKNLIQECHLKCVNFEGAIAMGNPITIRGTAVLPQSKNSPEWCEQNGFNVISLANNHMLDYGQEALIATMKAFKTATLIGAGDWDEAYQIKRVEINSIHIGFLALAQCEFGILNDNWGANNLLGSAWINHSRVNSLILKEKRTLDYLFVIAHAGIEYYDIPLPEWRDRYKELIDLGADAIIGGHPHVPQGWELYKGKPIFYSLGNFFFDIESEREYWNNGLSVMLEFDYEKNITFKIINTIRRQNEIIIDTSDQIKKHNEIICQKLFDREGYMNDVNKLCLEIWPSYENVLLRALNGERTTFAIKNLIKFFLFILKRRTTEYRYLLNYIRCESSRFVIVRSIKLLTRVQI